MFEEKYEGGFAHSEISKYDSILFDSLQVLDISNTLININTVLVGNFQTLNIREGMIANVKSNFNEIILKD